MRRRINTKPKPGQIGNYWLSKKPGREHADGAWCRTWYDRRSRQTCRVSLGTTDFQEASLVLATWVVENDRAAKGRPDQVTIDNVLMTYWGDHAQHLPSSRTQWNGLSYWTEFWTGRMVADITPNEQRRFRQWLKSKGANASGIDRILSVGRAALNRAVKWQELSEAPHIFSLETVEERRSREPKGRPIAAIELARLMDAAKSRHMLAYLVIAANTLARPGAILDLRRVQFDEPNCRLDLNPPGRRQNKKFRPILPVTPTLLPWLQGDVEPNARYVAYARAPIESISHAWQLLREEAGIDEKVRPYSIRHGMARELRKRKVPSEQISLFLGHLPKGSDATTSIYAPYEPDYCAEAVAAIESVMAEVRRHLKRADIDQPRLNAAELAKTIVSKTEYGVGDTKRKEVRFLILSGLPHAEVVKRSGVSGGTVSAIRTEIGEQIPLYRNSESGVCVPFACRKSKKSDRKKSQPFENIGGPGRTRTCDQTVMSGQL